MRPKARCASAWSRCWSMVAPARCRSLARRCSRICRRVRRSTHCASALANAGAHRAAHGAGRSRLEHAVGHARGRAAHRTHRRRAAVDERRDRGRRDPDSDRAGDGVRHRRARDDARRARAHADRSSSRAHCVADLGSGSGVLAIAAAKLGAGRVVAIEMDPDAIGNCDRERRAQRRRGPQVIGAAGRRGGASAARGAGVARAREHHLVRRDRAVTDHAARASPWRRGGDQRHSRDGARASARDRWLPDGWTLESELREGEWWSSVIARQ